MLFGLGGANGVATSHNPHQILSMDKFRLGFERAKEIERDREREWERERERDGKVDR